MFSTAAQTATPFSVSLFACRFTGNEICLILMLYANFTGDNGQIVRERLSFTSDYPWINGAVWQEYPQPFDNEVFRDIRRYDDVDYVEGDDTMYGDGGNDIIHGQVRSCVLRRVAPSCFSYDRSLTLDRLSTSSTLRSAPQRGNDSIFGGEGEDGKCMT